MSEQTRPRRRFLRVAVIVLCSLAVPGVIGAVNTNGKFTDMYAPPANAASVRPQTVQRPHDPDKPTVAFVVNPSGTNVTDLLAPYEVLAGTGEVNAYVVGPTTQLATLTGGLDIAPDLSFDGLADLLAGQRDELEAVVVPAFQPATDEQNAPLYDWLRAQAADGALMVSVCHGSRPLAAAGLLDGRPATSHWFRVAKLQEDYPQVDWVRGTRYVDDGDVITTGGVLSGVDGGLRLVERLLGDEAAQQAADRVRWSHYSPGKPATMPKYAWEASDYAVYVNSAFGSGPATIGVQVTEGVSELELAAPFVSYTEESMVGWTLAVGDTRGVVSQHGLTFVPRTTAADADVDRLLVPGVQAARDRAGTPTGDGVRPEYLHGSGEFAFDPILRDLVRTYDQQTARSAAKLLEYPEADVERSGDSWPWLATLTPFGLALLTAAVLVALGKVVRRLRRRPAEPVAVSEPEREPVGV